MYCRIIPHLNNYFEFFFVPSLFLCGFCQDKNKCENISKAMIKQNTKFFSNSDAIIFTLGEFSMVAKREKIVANYLKFFFRAYKSGIRCDGGS